MKWGDRYGSILSTMGSSMIRLEIRAAQDPGRRDVHPEFLTGPRALRYPPALGFRGNPLLLFALDRDARELSAATDITGFGLLGHASEIALASGVGLDFEYDQIPFIDACHKFAREFTFPGGASDNKLYFEWQVSFDLALNDAEQMLLFDPQTSGGLLMCVPEEKVGNFQKLANERGIPVWEIGVVNPEPGLRVHRS